MCGRLSTCPQDLKHGWAEGHRRTTLLRLSDQILHDPEALIDGNREGEDFHAPLFPRDYFDSRLGFEAIHALFLSLCDPRFLEPLLDARRILGLERHVRSHFEEEADYRHTLAAMPEGDRRLYEGLLTRLSFYFGFSIWLVERSVALGGFQPRWPTLMMGIAGTGEFVIRTADASSVRRLVDAAGDRLALDPAVKERMGQHFASDIARRDIRRVTLMSRVPLVRTACIHYLSRSGGGFMTIGGAIEQWKHHHPSLDTDAGTFIKQRKVFRADQLDLIVTHRYREHRRELGGVNWAADSGSLTPIFAQEWFNTAYNRRSERRSEGYPQRPWWRTGWAFAMPARSKRQARTPRE